MTTRPCAGDDRFTSDVARERQEAARICTDCPIQTACAAGALERREAWGVWGGMDMMPGRNERDADRDHAPCPACGNRPTRKPDESRSKFYARQFCDNECRAEWRRHQPVNHGTLGGLRTHYRRGETPCDACYQAGSNRNRRAS